MAPAIAVRLAWLTALVSTAGRPGGSGGPPPVRWTARALALRHLVESATLIRRRYRRPPVWSVWVDALHCASMVAVAATSRRLRVPALISAAAASAISAVSALARRG